jgi:hypothetical protein
MLYLHHRLAEQDPLPSKPADAVVGFGHFNLGIARRCIELFRDGRAKHAIFTGGIGRGTADLGEPEADAFLRVLYGEAPEFTDRIIIENKSTNTAANISFTEALLQSDYPQLALGDGIRSVLLVATPWGQRRVRLTWQKMQPQVKALNAPPSATFEELSTLYASKGQSSLDQMLGEYQRICDYPAKGWIAQDLIPAEIHEAAQRLSAKA